MRRNEHQPEEANVSASAVSGYLPVSNSQSKLGLYFGVRTKSRIISQTHPFHPGADGIAEGASFEGASFPSGLCSWHP